MKLTWYEPKRAQTLERRVLDFAHADRVFAGRTITHLDDRRDYGEERFQTIGRLNNITVMVVWTPRGETRHIFSMRKCNVRERKRYQQQLE